MSLLLPDSGLLFWMTLVFLVVFFILWKWGFPSIIKMVNERKEYIDESLAKAEEANLRLANIQKQGEELLMEAREKQAQILREASETRDTIVGQAQEKARDESARILLKPRQRLKVRSRLPSATSVRRLQSFLCRLLRRFCIRNCLVQPSKLSLSTAYWMKLLLLTEQKVNNRL